MDDAEPDVLAYMSYPSGPWSMLASNNGLERLNRELKRRCDVMQIFPKDASLRLLAGGILMEQHDEWQVARRQASRELMGEVPTKDDALLAREAEE